jgi:hypothetical protein
MALASTILMVRPAAFGFNEQTAANNFFQGRPAPGEDASLQEKVLAEFDNMARQLVEYDIEVIAIEDTDDPPKPDAIFPNNWFCTFPSGVLSVFPMYAPNRRNEKRDEILHWIVESFETSGFEDWSEYEAEGYFLEGTGSMVMDHANRIIYACISERTSLSLLQKFAPARGYLAMPFNAVDISGKPIYHTNVMMCIGEGFAVICTDAIADETERIAVTQLLESTGHHIIRISLQQMHAFAGNMLELKNMHGKKFIIMSETAWNSLEDVQRERLNAYAAPIVIPVPTIEQEGGSVRCMMAEIFLDAKIN